MKLPQTSDSDRTSALAVTYCQEVFERRNWKFRRQEGKSDFGIDAECEVVDANLVTGRVFKLQVKGSQALKWKAGECSVTIKTSTYNLWASMLVPVIALLCDVETRKIYWNLPISQAPQLGAATMALRFTRYQNLDETFDSLEKLLTSWFRTFTENILREVPFFYAVFQRLREVAAFGDPWSMLDEDTDTKCRLFYRHCIQLRLRLGLTCNHIPLLDDWYIRSAVTWGDDFQLFWGTFDELIRYIEPDYKEAITELQKRSSLIEPRFESSELINFFRSLRGEPQYGAIHDGRFEGADFLRRMDQLLKTRGAFKYATRSR